MLLRESDFVVSLIPLTRQTENFFNKATFTKMKSSAIFINVSRGGVVDEADLYHALKHREIKAAGLDVFKDEPIDAMNPLAALDNVVLLPHIGSATIATREQMLTLCLENIKSVFVSGRAKTPVF